MPSVSRLRRRVAFAQVIEGDVAGPKRRHCERSVMQHLATSGISPEAVVIGGDGCSFIVDSRDSSRLASAVRDLNVAVKIHDRCARVALTRTATDWPLPALNRVIEVFDDEGIDLVNLTSDATALTVLVDERDADRVVSVFSRFYRPAADKAPGSLAS
jgi:aspartokinase